MKVPPPSLEYVQCYYCDLIQRKNNLKRHIDVKHKKKRFRWRVVVSQGQSSLLERVPGGAKAIVTDIQCSNSVENINNPIMAEIEERFCNVSLNRDNEDPPTPTRIVYSHDTEDNKISDGGIEGIKSDFREVASEIKNSVSDIMAKFTEILFVREIERPNISKPEMLASSETNPDQDTHLIKECTSADQLLNILPNRGFQFNEETYKFRH